MIMRNGQSLGQNGALVRPAQDGMTPAAVAPATKEIPYDYVARFTLQGKRGNRAQDVINTSVDGRFVWMAIGYSFIPAKLPPLPSSGGILLQQPPIGDDGVSWLVTNALLSVVDDPRMLAQSLL